MAMNGHDLFAKADRQVSAPKGGQREVTGQTKGAAQRPRWHRFTYHSEGRDYIENEDLDHALQRGVP
jgi:hypothetical protein